MSSISRPLRHSRNTSVKGLLLEQLRIWHALMMHDIKSRFFGNGLGYAVTIAWPLFHIVVILVLNTNRVAPYGSSMILYAATAVIPYIACNYIGRFIIMGVMTNKSFLQYPLIKPLDLMFSRAILEIVSNYIVVVVVLSTMAVLGIDVVPLDIKNAALALAASMMLGVCFGVLNGVIAIAFPLWHIVYIFIMILAWITCGITLNPEFLPEQFGYYLSFNPVLHAVEWMRQAYYPDFQARLLDKSYLVSFSLGCLGIGLVSERLARRFLSRPG